MRYSLRHDLSLFAVSALAGIAAGAAAEEQDAYQPLVQGPRVISDRSLDSPGIVQLGLGWSSSDSFMFGEYNGLHEEGGSLIGKLQWQDFSAGDSYWQVSLQDVGLDTREGIATWGKPGKVKLSLGFDSQLQVRNDSGRTPFLGKDTLTLPGDWQSGRQTGDWAALDDSLYNFDRELERNRYFIELDATLAEHWHIESSLSYEEKEGTADVTGAIYTDASGGDAVSLPQPIDYRTTEFDLGIGYTRKSLQLQGTLFYSDFDNRDNLLTWQNPYSSFGPDVRYPQGIGGLGTAPDSEQLGGRFNGQYIFNPGIRLQFDGSYSITEQDQDYPGYTVNQNLEVFEPLPRTDFDGELATGTFGTRLLVRASRKLDLEGYYKVRDRDYDGPRDGYRYNRGDGADQPRESLTIYNSTRDFTSQTMGIEGSYRLPLRSRLKLGYAYKVEDRRNAAVEETEEDIYSASYRIQPRSDVTARIELVYSDRSADTYHWDQSYFALLDTALINATPDNQRYITHPELSQYHLSNREQTQVKIDLNYLPTPAWSLALNLQWHDDDYDKSDLGLTDAEWQRLHLSASYTASNDLLLSVYAGYDDYQASQGNRAFRGGQEKNAFAAYPPLPQASDPLRDWDIDSEDNSFTLGASLEWQASSQLDITVDYNYVDTTAAQDMRTRSRDLVAGDLPDVDTTMHHLTASGSWQLHQNLSLVVDYQYYRFKSDDWAWQDVQPDTMGQVLSFGQRNPNEKIHYVGASVLYRWQ